MSYFDAAAPPSLREPPALDLAWAREQFPSLSMRVGDQPVAFFDNPAGTQVPRQVERRVREYFAESNANTHGLFLTSQRTDALVERARRLCAALLGAQDPAEIVFGANMTSLTLTFCRALGRVFQPGDELIVSELDHDANISPWLELESQGLVVRRIPIQPATGTLDLEAYSRLLSERTRLVAVGYAQNALGTVTDVPRIISLARAAGAWVWVDAVHLAPHRAIDVAALDADFLVCSAYKFFGPHVGVLYGKRELLERLPAQRIRPAPGHAPDKFESGTKNHEGLAGLVGAVEYLAALGAGPEHAALDEDAAPELVRARLVAAMEAIAAHEAGLSRQLLAGLRGISGAELFGLSSPDSLGDRVPTFAFRLRGVENREVARRLAARGLFVWAGHHYALTLMERLGLGSEGVVRAGAVHYNTAGEVERLLEALGELAPQHASALGQGSPRDLDDGRAVGGEHGDASALGQRSPRDPRPGRGQGG